MEGDLALQDVGEIKCNVSKTVPIILFAAKMVASIAINLHGINQQQSCRVKIMIWQST